MKSTSVVLLSVLGLVVASYAEAANKKNQRSRNSSRAGAYGVFAMGQANYSSDFSDEEALLVDALVDEGANPAEVSASTDDSDFGYQATFGYRFNRHFAAELGLVQVGELASTASGVLDFGQGPVDASLTLKFSAGGPMISFLGILPVSERFEIFGRAGYLFTSTDRAVSSRVDGDSQGFGSSKGDSQDLALGLGAAFHFNQVYSARLEYLRLGEIGEAERSGTEEVSIISLGVLVRF
jgi:opacity protein-like surface antigen